MCWLGTTNHLGVLVNLYSWKMGTMGPLRFSNLNQLLLILKLQNSRPKLQHVHLSNSVCRDIDHLSGFIDIHVRYSDGTQEHHSESKGYI